MRRQAWPVPGPSLAAVEELSTWVSSTMPAAWRAARYRRRTGAGAGTRPRLGGLMRRHRALGNTTAQDELGREAWADFHGTALPIDTVYRLSSRSPPPDGSMIQAPSGRMRRPTHRPNRTRGISNGTALHVVDRPSVRRGTSRTFDVERVALGERADVRVARVAYRLGRLSASGSDRAWTCGPSATPLSRSSVVRTSRRCRTPRRLSARAVANGRL